MLTVKVTLEPWWGSETDNKVIADMTIYNDGTGKDSHGNYVAMTHNMNGLKAKRTGEVKEHYRNQDVWSLVSKALKDMGYE